MNELDEMDVTVYGISPATNKEHAEYAEINGLDFELLSDTELEFGVNLGFVDAEEQAIYRGFVAVNPETGQLISEVDYLVGENADEVLKRIEDL